MIPALFPADDPGVSFFLSCVPPKTSHHAKRIVKRGPFASLADKPELLAAKDTIDSLLLPFQIPTPIPGPVHLEIEWTWPWLAGHSKKIRSHGRIRHTSKPDLTNVAKTLEDRLVRLRFLEDDNAVAILVLSKWWGDRPGIAVSIRSL